MEKINLRIKILKDELVKKKGGLLNRSTNMGIWIKCWRSHPFSPQGRMRLEISLWRILTCVWKRVKFRPFFSVKVVDHNSLQFFVSIVKFSSESCFKFSLKFLREKCFDVICLNIFNFAHKVSKIHKVHKVSSLNIELNLKIEPKWTLHRFCIKHLFPNIKNLLIQQTASCTPVNILKYPYIEVSVYWNIHGL